LTQVNDWGRRDERLVHAAVKSQLDRVTVLVNSGIDPAKIDPTSGLTAYVYTAPGITIESEFGLRLLVGVYIPIPDECNLRPVFF